MIKIGKFAFGEPFGVHVCIPELKPKAKNYTIDILNHH